MVVEYDVSGYAKNALKKYVDLDDVITQWRDDLVQYGLDRLADQIHRTRTINRTRGQERGMATDERTDERGPLDDVMEEIRRELVLRVAQADRDEHRDIYDALENE